MASEYFGNLANDIYLSLAKNEITIDQLNIKPEDDPDGQYVKALENLVLNLKYLIQLTKLNINNILEIYEFNNGYFLLVIESNKNIYFTIINAKENKVFPLIAFPSENIDINILQNSIIIIRFNRNYSIGSIHYNNVGSITILENIFQSNFKLLEILPPVNIIRDNLYFGIKGYKFILDEYGEILSLNVDVDNQNYRYLKVNNSFILKEDIIFH